MKGFPRVAAMLLFSGALAGYSASTLVDRHYRARAEFAFVSPLPVDPAVVLDRASEITLLPQSLELMIRRSPSFKNRLYVESIGDLITETRTGLSIKSASANAAPGGVIEFEDDDPDLALDVTRVTLSEFGGNAARVAGAKKAADVIRIVKAPETRLTGLTPLLLTALGIAAGLLLSLFVWILLPRSRPHSAS